MYKIIQNGRQIGLAEHPAYVMLLDNGYYGLCNAAEAGAVVYDGTVYPLGGEDGVLLIETDAGTVLDEQRRQAESQLASADEAAIELYEASLAQREITAAQDDALIELYEMLGGEI